MITKSLQEQVDEITYRHEELDSFQIPVQNQLNLDIGDELSGYSTYTPIDISSRTVAYNADLERNNRRNR